jgi:ketosteroid isomerase-like protein
MRARRGDTRRSDRRARRLIGAPPVERVGNTLSILNRRADGWKIARDANMLAPVGQ